MEGSKCLK